MNFNFEDSLGYELQHQWFHIGVLFSGSAFKIEIYLLLINVKHREWFLKNNTRNPEIDTVCTVNS